MAGVVSGMCCLHFCAVRGNRDMSSIVIWCPYQFSKQNKKYLLEKVPWKLITFCIAWNSQLVTIRFLAQASTGDADKFRFGPSLIHGDQNINVMLFVSACVKRKHFDFSIAPFHFFQFFINLVQIFFFFFLFASNIASLPAEMVTKICTDSGHWFLHPLSNRTWTNYTRCNEHTNEGRVVGHKWHGTNKK